MTFYFCNNENGFLEWCHHLAPAAIAYLKQFKARKIDVIYDKKYYRDCLRIKRQFTTLELLLDDEHLLFLEDVLFKGLHHDRNPQTKQLYREIYELWSKVCFPKGKSPIKTIDPVLLGGELRLLRINKRLNIKRVAGITNISSDSIYAYEEGIRMIKADALHKLAQVYEINITELLQTAEINWKVNENP